MKMSEIRRVRNLRLELIVLKHLRGSMLSNARRTLPPFTGSDSAMLKTKTVAPEDLASTSPVLDYVKSLDKSICGPQGNYQDKGNNNFERSSDDCIFCHCP